MHAMDSKICFTICQDTSSEHPSHLVGSDFVYDGFAPELFDYIPACIWLSAGFGRATSRKETR